MGGDEHPQARRQASYASDVSSPTTAQRDPGSSATQAQCFDGVFLLYHDELSTHVEDGAGASACAVGGAVVGSAFGAAVGAAVGGAVGAKTGLSVGAGVYDT